MYPHPRHPGRRHWSAIEQIQIDLPQMTPEEFVAYWDVTYGQLAQICFCSEMTVKRWFAGSREPAVLHKLWLALTHETWSGL